MTEEVKASNLGSDELDEIFQAKLPQCIVKKGVLSGPGKVKES